MFQFAAARNHQAARKLLLSWNLEIPELAGSSEEDAIKLARLPGVDANEIAGNQPAVPQSAQAPAAVDEPPVARETSQETASKTTINETSMVETKQQVSTYEISKVPSELISDDAETTAITTQVESELFQHVASDQMANETYDAEATGQVTSGEVQDTRLEPLAMIKASETLILAIPPGRYTLQLAVMSAPAQVDNFIHQFQLSGDLYHYRFTRGSSTLYGLSIGEFLSREDANAFSRELEQTMQKKPAWQSPWLRPFTDVQQLIREMRTPEH